MGFQTTLLRSAEQLRARAAAWDRLWESGDVTLPTVRAELVALWTEQFAPNSEFTAICVEKDQQLLAALPLVGRTVRGLLPVGDLTLNFWSPNGDLLAHPTDEGGEAFQAIAAALDESSWPLLYFDTVPYQTTRWSRLIECLQKYGHPVALHHRYTIGQVEIGDDFQRYLGQRSKQFMRALRKRLRRLQASGPLELEVGSQFDPAELTGQLREAFEIERRGWKGNAGTAVLDVPEVFDFYVRQARQLAAWNQLLLVFLVHRGKRIAFEMGWTAKGVYHSFKVGFDAEYRAFSPGHLLRLLLLERFHSQRGWRLVDFQGPMTEALAAWSTRSYEIGRLLISPKRARSRMLFAGIRLAGAAVRGLRRLRHPTKSLSQNLARRGGQAHFAPKTPQNEPVPDGFGIGSK